MPDKKPKHKHNPQIAKVPTYSEKVDSLETSRFRWQINRRYVDYNDNEWGWHGVPAKKFFDKCLDFLQSYEGETWAKLKEDKHCHPVRIKDIAQRAQTLISNRFGDIDDFYQVKAQGECRLFGRKEKQILYLVWHDEHHTVYPGSK